MMLLEYQELEPVTLKGTLYFQTMVCVTVASLWPLPYLVLNAQGLEGDMGVAYVRM